MTSTSRQLLASAWAILAIPAAAAGAEIVIGARDLRPQTATAALGERVVFINRSGGAAHVEFHAAPAGHRIFHVPGEIWAIFYAPGRHGYTVHLSSATMELHGVVDMGEGTVVPKDALRECTGIAVMGECLER